MKIAIIGAGFTGLSAAYYLTKSNNRVTVFEKEKNPGGLALGFKEKKWQWTLESHYHHWFENDKSILGLAEEIEYETLLKRPKTSVYVDNNIYQLDSPQKVFSFPKLTITDRLRMASTLGLLRYNPFWKPLEKIRAANFLSQTMGKNAYEMLWEPQLHNKFGSYTNDISLAWFWARIKKRTASLAYPKGGFLSFANALVKKIEENGGKVLLNTEVKEIISGKNAQVKFGADKGARLLDKRGTVKLEIGNYDAVVVTLPSFFFTKITPQLPQNYKNMLSKLKGIGAINLILRLNKQFFTDGTYWLSVCDKKSPIMAIVEHTNFMDKKYYNNEHIIYIGNYFPHDHPYMKLSAEELLKIYDPYLRKINPSYQSTIISFQLFKTPFAQPIIPINYSKIIPPFKTPLKNIYLANIQQVYPWDRGTNYAVELGEKVAKLVQYEKK